MDDRDSLPDQTDDVPFPTPSVPEGFRPPLMSIETEQALLGAVLIHNSAAAGCPGLRAEHFYEPLHGHIWGAMQRLIAAGSVADHVTLRVETEAVMRVQYPGANGMLADYLGRMVRNATTILNAPDYGAHITELAGRRRLAEVAKDAYLTAEDAAVTDSLVEQLALLRGELDRIDAEHRSVEVWRPTQAVIEGEMARLLSAAERQRIDPGSTEGWSTGLAALDDAFGGGIRTPRLYAVQARAGVGKTMLAGTICWHLMQQRVPVAFVALEMGAERILARMIATETGGNIKNWQEVATASDYAAAARSFLVAHAGAELRWAYEPGCSFDRLRMILTDAVERLGVRVFAIDYWQLITGVRRGERKADHLTEVADWLAAFAGRHDVAVFLTAQTNRDGDVYGSDGLKKACDWLGAMHQVSGYGGAQSIWIQVQKSRDGVAKSIGSADKPAFEISPVGPHIAQVSLS